MTKKERLFEGLIYASVDDMPDIDAITSEYQWSLKAIAGEVIKQIACDDELLEMLKRVIDKVDKK